MTKREVLDQLTRAAAHRSNLALRLFPSSRRCISGGVEADGKLRLSISAPASGQRYGLSSLCTALSV